MTLRYYPLLLLLYTLKIVSTVSFTGSSNLFATCSTTFLLLLFHPPTLVIDNAYTDREARVHVTSRGWFIFQISNSSRKGSDRFGIIVAEMFVRDVYLFVCLFFVRGRKRRIGRRIVRFAAGKGKPRQFGDKPHVRHGILIRWECWPTAKRPQRFLNTRRKWVASVPVVQGSGMVRAGSKEGMPRGNANRSLASNYFFSERSVPLLDPRSSLRSRDPFSIKRKRKNFLANFSFLPSNDSLEGIFPIPKDSADERKFDPLLPRETRFSYIL